jgi:hypothetical protein
VDFLPASKNPLTRIKKYHTIFANVCRMSMTHFPPDMLTAYHIP